MPLATAIGLARQCANALEAAHKAGIVHRDLKPDNVFLVPDVEVVGGERVKLLDFGVAKLVGGGAASVARTVTGAILGTPHYMSPEQCEGAREVDARSDLYSLGCMLFQMVSGRLPFQSPGIGGLIGMHLHVAPPLLRSMRPDAPAELEALIGKLLEKDPDVRIQTATEVAAALTQLPMTESMNAVVPMRPTPVPVDALMPTVMSVVEPPRVNEAPTVTTQHTGTRRRWLWVALAAVVAVIAVIVIVRSGDDPEARMVAIPPVEVSPPTAPAGGGLGAVVAPPVAPAPPATTPAPPAAAPSEVDFEIAVGKSRLRERKFKEALAQAKEVLKKQPSHPAALELAKDAKHGITEHLLATMRTHLVAKRYNDVKRILDDVHRVAVDPAQRAAADQMWAKVKPEWTAAETARKAAAELERKRLEIDTNREAQIQGALGRIGDGKEHVIVAGCIDLMRLDRSRVPWERCIVAQCDINPGGVGTLLLNAPQTQAQRLQALCPIPPPRPRPPVPAPQAPAPAQAPGPAP